MLNVCCLNSSLLVSLSRLLHSCLWWDGLRREARSRGKESRMYKLRNEKRLLSVFRFICVRICGCGPPFLSLLIPQPEPASKLLFKINSSTTAFYLLSCLAFGSTLHPHATEPSDQDMDRAERDYSQEEIGEALYSISSLLQITKTDCLECKETALFCSQAWATKLTTWFKGGNNIHSGLLACSPPTC